MRKCLPLMVGWSVSVLLETNASWRLLSLRTTLTSYSKFALSNSPTSLYPAQENWFGFPCYRGHVYVTWPMAHGFSKIPRTTVHGSKKTWKKWWIMDGLDFQLFSSQTVRHKFPWTSNLDPDLQGWRLHQPACRSHTWWSTWSREFWSSEVRRKLAG